MPPWIIAYVILSIFLSQQWIKTLRTNPEQTVIYSGVIALTSYFAYKAIEKDKRANTVQERLTGVDTDGNGELNFLLQHNKPLLKAMNRFTKNYKWIDPAAYKDVMQSLDDFLKGYSRILLMPPNTVQQQDAEDILEIRRFLLNTLYSFNLKNARLVHDPRFRDIVLTTHSATYRYLEILRNKHPNTLAAVLPPMPRAVEVNAPPLTSFDLV